MALHKIEKGLDLPISGKPIQVVRHASSCTRVAVMADDFPGMKPRMHVEEGQTVKRGQVLFEDRKQPGVFHTAPGAGRVIAIHRGEKRALQSIVIDLSDGERQGDPAEDEIASFESYTGAAPESLSRDQIRELLVESGLWTALRQRPYSKVPSPQTEPAGIFITATDTHPLAPLPEVALADREAWVSTLLRRSVVRARREAIGIWGTRIYRDDRGRVQVQMAVGPDADAQPPGRDGPAVLSAWRDAIELDYPDAKALQRELVELLARYQSKRGAQRYVLHLGLAPVAPEDVA